MDFFKSDVFKFGLIFGGNVLMGMALKKYNTCIEKQTICIGLQSILSIAVTIDNKTDAPGVYLSKIALVTGSGIITGKILYDGCSTYKSEQRPLVNIPNTTSYDLNSLLNTELTSSGNTSANISMFYKQIREHAVIPLSLGLCLVAGGTIYIGYLCNKNHMDIMRVNKEYHEDIKKRLVSMLRICRSNSFRDEVRTASKIDYTDAIKFLVA